jgi:hypothetical protein
MRTSEKTTIMHEIEIHVKYWCDWCGKEIVDPGGYEVDEFQLYWRTGENYGTDGSWGVTKKVDLCNACRDRLFNFLEENKCKVQNNKWDY